MSNFSFPDSVPDLSGVPTDLHDCYVANAEGGFSLTLDARDLLDEHAKTVALLESEHAAATAAADARLQAADDRIKALLTTSALADVLDGLAVPQRLQRGATARLREVILIEVDEPSEDGGGPVLVVRDNFGLLSLESAVAKWLASDDGAGYRSAAPQPGKFAEMIAAMSKPR